MIEHDPQEPGALRVGSVDLEEERRALVVVMEDGRRLEIAADAEEARDLVPGLVLSPGALGALEAAAARKDTARRVFAMLDRRARGREDLRRRLLAEGREPGVVDPVLDQFEREGLVDDVHYATEWSRPRIEHKGVGRRWLVARLSAQGVDGADARRGADRAYDDCGLDESTVAAQALRRRRLDMEDQRQRERGLRFLASRGFSRGVALAAMRAVRDEESSADEPFEDAFADPPFEDAAGDGDLGDR